MITRYGWPGALTVLAIGLVLWFVVAPLLSPPAFATIVMVIGILMAVVGGIALVAALVGGNRPL